MKAVHKVSGAVVHAEKDVLSRLGPGWEIESSKPKTTTQRKPRKTAARKTIKKTES